MIRLHTHGQVWRRAVSTLEVGIEPTYKEPTYCAVVTCMRFE